MTGKLVTSSKVDGVLHWQCVCICANPQLYVPRPVERQCLERVIRAYRNRRRLRDRVQSLAKGVIHTCKQRLGSLRAPRRHGRHGHEPPQAERASL